MKQYTTTTILIILLVLTIGYIGYQEGYEYLEEQRNLYYNQGGENGITYWNNQVIDTVNQRGVIPFLVNGSVQSIPIKQLCEKLG